MVCLYPNLRRFTPNRLERQFDIATLNQVWTTDITYIWKFEGLLYLTVVIDLFSRQAVGWAVADHMKTSLCVTALQMAFLPIGRKGAESQSLVCSIIRIGAANMPAMNTAKTFGYHENGAGHESLRELLG